MRVSYEMPESQFLHTSHAVMHLEYHFKGGYTENDLLCSIYILQTKGGHPRKLEIYGIPHIALNIEFFVLKICYCRLYWKNNIERVLSLPYRH